jgi:hypothetical protein
MIEDIVFIFILIFFILTLIIFGWALFRIIKRNKDGSESTEKMTKEEGKVNIFFDFLSLFSGGGK